MQPQTCTERKTRQCRMLPEGTCEECPRTKWLVCLLRVSIVQCVNTVRCVTIYGILYPWVLPFGRILGEFCIRACQPLQSLHRAMLITSIVFSL